MDLEAKITHRDAAYGVVGLGYVGLPLALEFARAGFRVTGFEVDQKKVQVLAGGGSYIEDVPAEELEPLVKQGRIVATVDFEPLSEMDVISICVPTPLSKTRDPDMSFVMRVTEEVTQRLRKGQLVILESTTYPGTTDEVVRPALELSGLTAGEDFHLAFSPERVDPGNRDYGVRNTPKVVGGVDARSGELAAHFYRQAIEDVVCVSSAAAAEMSKLLENTFRSVNVALVNEVALMCDRLGLDVWEVIDAAATKPFGFMKFVPGPGLGGHCVPIDPFYLAWKLRSLNYRARFIELAGEVNSEMPHYVVRKVTEALNDRERSVRGSRILLMGVAYKSNVGDTRESPALDILRLLEDRGATVVYTDPHVPSLRFEGKEYASVECTEEELRKADCVVVTCSHRAFDFQLVASHAKLVVDARNAFPRTGPERGPARVVRL
jgi:UDP-N-acetyl-D-glucosamine dehydrogenase